MKDLIILFAVMAVVVLLPLLAKAFGFGRTRKSETPEAPAQPDNMIQEKSSYARK